MKNVIFLDIDGVLNRTCGGYFTEEKSPLGFTGIDQKYISNLKELVDLTESEIVLTSDWKDCFNEPYCNPAYADDDGKYLVQRFKENGLKIKEKTLDRSVGNDIGTGRGNGIRDYLKKHPDIQNYVILDDVKFRDFNNELEDHLVLTLNALNSKAMKKAMKILTKNQKTIEKTMTTAESISKYVDNVRIFE